MTIPEAVESFAAQVLPVVVTGLASIGTAGIPVGIAFLVVHIKLLRTKLGAALAEHVTAVALQAVRTVDQTFVAAIKDSSNDGKLTLGEAKQAQDRALALLKAQLGPVALAQLAKIKGVAGEQLDDLLVSTNEAAKHAMDGSSGPTAEAVAIAPPAAAAASQGAIPATEKTS